MSVTFVLKIGLQTAHNAVCDAKAAGQGNKRERNVRRPNSFGCEFVNSQRKGNKRRKALAAQSPDF